ncbi:hypothetical protein C8F01DRAFT_1082248 [Mycena amicta]|nr:hypothetical protein C8F01DRAFT_1082248 [Mycena amicta]
MHIDVSAGQRFLGVRSRYRAGTKRLNGSHSIHLRLGVTFHAFSISGRIDPGSTSYGTDSPPPEENSNMQLPEHFKHHPHSCKPADIIPLDSSGPSDPPAVSAKSQPQDRPWAPFRCLADATLTYRWVSRRMANREVDEDLEHLRSDWAIDSNVTFRNHREMEKALDTQEGSVRVRVKHTEDDAQKPTIYHAVCQVVMALASLEPRSHNGEVLRFGDGVTRTAHPGVLIESMDFEEMAAWLAICNSRSNHPCPKCLVHHSDPHKLFERSERRSPQEMLRVPREAAKLHPTQREDLLKGYGLHNFIPFLLSFDHSDPYAAACCDLLHYFDRVNGAGTGTFGSYSKSTFNRRDSHHVLTTIRLAMSRTAAAAELMPRSHRTLDAETPHYAWLSVTTRPPNETRNMSTLARALQEVHEVCGKDFNFLVQHSLSHAIEDFMSKGTSRNMNTRVDKGFQQEIGLQDEREETMARVQMAIDDWRRSQKAVELDEGEQPIIPRVERDNIGTLEARFSDPSCLSPTGRDRKSGRSRVP